MSLVAYDNSDSDGEDDQIENTDVENSTIGSSLQFTDNHNTTSDHKSLFSSLPIPKSQIKDNIEPEDEIENTSGSSTGRNQPVKIYLEPLSKFADVDKPSRKPRVQSSGSGLFSVLPPPKNTMGKVANRSLVPHSLTRKSTPSTASKPVVRKPTTTTSHNGDEDDSEVPEDFFGLANAKSADTTVEAIIPAKASISKFLPPPTLNPDVTMEEVTSSTSDTDQTEPMDETAVNVSKAQKIDDLFQDQAFMRVRGKKRAFEEDTQIIDVSQDDQMPSWEERAKLLTQEDENAYANSGPTPSAQHRRKHQITYLAYQAKARELELKNQWASNRFTKQQTKAKYGF